MKTKTLAFSLMLSLTGYAVVAQTDSIPTKDSIPKTDTAKVVDATAFNANHSDVINFSLSEKVNVTPADTTAPGNTDSTKKDSSMVYNLNRNGLLQISDFAVRDTVPSDTSDTTKKDSTMASALRNNSGLVAFNFAVRDTVPSDTAYTTKKDSSLVFNSQREKLLQKRTDLQVYSNRSIFKHESEAEVFNEKNT